MSSIWDGVPLGQPPARSSSPSLASISSVATDAPSSVDSLLSEGLGTSAVKPLAMPSAVDKPESKKHWKYSFQASTKILVQDGSDLLEYNLPQQPFVRQSSFFRTFFGQPPSQLLPGWDSYELEDGSSVYVNPEKKLARRARPAILEVLADAYCLDVASSEFDAFLSVLCPENYVTFGLTLASEWTAVLKLATRWSMSSIRELAILRLHDLLLDDPLERLVLARTYQIHEWVDAARLALCDCKLPLRAAEIVRLSPEDVEFISDGRITPTLSALLGADTSYVAVSRVRELLEAMAGEKPVHAVRAGKQRELSARLEEEQAAIEAQKEAKAKAKASTNAKAAADAKALAGVQNTTDAEASLFAATAVAAAAVFETAMVAVTNVKADTDTAAVKAKAEADAVTPTKATGEEVPQVNAKQEMLAQKENDVFDPARRTNNGLSADDNIARLHAAHSLHVGDIEAKHARALQALEEKLEAEKARADEAEATVERKKLEIRYLEEDYQEKDDEFHRLEEELQHLKAARRTTPREV